MIWFGSKVVIVYYVLLVPFLILQVDANGVSPESPTNNHNVAIKRVVTTQWNSNHKLKLFSLWLLQAAKSQSQMYYQRSRGGLNSTNLNENEQYLTSGSQEPVFESGVQISDTFRSRRSVLLENGSSTNVNAGGSEIDGDDNCTHPTEPLPYYNNSCEFVHAECADKAELIDYLAFVCCDLAVLQPLGMVLMGIWLLYLIALLATTVDNHFVPPLTFLADKLKLSPSVAGITLLALGNGAPDIFVVYSGLVHDDLGLVLGALTGAAIFITSIVLGSVVLFNKVSPMNVDKVDFIRDLIALFVVVGTVVAVAFDGKVFLFEACLFPLIYIMYIGCVVALSYIRDFYAKKKQNIAKRVEEDLHYSDEVGVNSISLEDSFPMTEPQKLKKTEYQPLTESKPKGNSSTNSPHLNGLTLPKGRSIFFKILWLIQWPFSLLRWMTIPPFSHDGNWSRLHYLLASFSPLPISMLLLLTVRGWNGFKLYAGHLPLPILLLLIAICVSALMFFLLSSRNPPHWALQMYLVPVAFIMAIMWLNLQANEIISVLRAFGLLLTIDTAILGLTVLAIGNCVADWVADVVVARAGHPEMAVASCFGSPLLSHVLGLSIALIVKIGIYNHGAPYRFHIHTPSYTEVKLSWIFLGVSLAGNAVLFPLFRFSPPRIVGPLLMSVYIVFVLFAVLGETGVLPVKL